ncbi:hypothetical protein GQ457_04G026940 [Hibiscus cannabinus]
MELMHENARHFMLYLKLYMHISHRCFNILQALVNSEIKQILKRNQLENKMANRGNGVKFMRLKQFVWKVKSQWTQRQASRSQRSSMRFSYDLHSYSLNFDDGFSHDELNPTL